MASSSAFAIFKSGVPIPDFDGVNYLIERFADAFYGVLPRLSFLIEFSTSYVEIIVAVGGLKTSPALGVKFLSLSGSILSARASRTASRSTALRSSVDS